MSNEKRNRMLEKVRALLNKADTSRGATEAESAAFMAKAQELMARHGIEAMEAHAMNDESCFDIGRSDWACDRGRQQADTYVFHVLKKCFGVDIVFTSYTKLGTKSQQLAYAIMGDAADREMAKIAAPIIFKTMRKGLSEWLKSTGSKWTAAFERSYCRGVMEGYTKASDEGKAFLMAQLSKEQKEQFGLILVQKDALIKTFMNKEFPRLKTLGSGRRGIGSGDAEQAGFGKGAGMKLTKTHAIG